MNCSIFNKSHGHNIIINEGKRNSHINSSPYSTKVAKLKMNHNLKDSVFPSSKNHMLSSKRDYGPQKTHSHSSTSRDQDATMKPNSLWNGPSYMR